MKADAYQVISDRMITLLEQGTVPWQKPWQSGDLMPRNLMSLREYRGVNVFLLHAMSYQSPFWLTFNQAKELGGNVKRGEKACPVVFWKWLDVTEEGEAKRVPFLRYYSVFNVAQCEGSRIRPLVGRAASPSSFLLGKGQPKCFHASMKKGLNGNSTRPLQYPIVPQKFASLHC
jgi:antirestriction protein ArdC